MEKLLGHLETLLESWNIDSLWSGILSRTVMGIGVILAALIVWWITAKIALKAFERLIRRTKTTWDDELFDKGVFQQVIQIIPTVMIWFLCPAVLTGLPILLSIIRGLMVLLMILLVAMAITRTLSAVNAIYSRREDAKRRPIKGIIQAVQVLVIVAAVILAFSVITKKPVSGLMAGLGALSAVLMLIFKDPLMGLVSGFQISSNDMVRIGDWIEVPSAGADGDVIDINLLNVTVRNWDKTYVTFPIQQLTTSGFKNWRGMNEAGGRRIKRSLSLDMNTIRFAEKQEIERWKKIQLLAPYLEERGEEIRSYNDRKGIDRTASPLNGRAMTNVGVFRAYAKAYVTAHPQVHEDMTIMVRQLQSGPEGLPLELYLFSRDIVWVNYETIQADIFDHLFASLAEFGLKAFQSPSGNDVRSINTEK